jgi:hypothetical protein
MEDQDDNEKIRPPDIVKKETLIDPDSELYFHNPDTDTNSNTNINININTDTDYELNKILELSKHEFDILQEKEEETIMKMFELEMEERLKTLSETKKLLHKMLVFDKPNTEIYKSVLSIIEMYQLGYINKYSMDTSNYHDTFRILKGLRINSQEFALLQNIIIEI